MAISSAAAAGAAALRKRAHAISQQQGRVQSRARSIGYLALPLSLSLPPDSPSYAHQRGVAQAKVHRRLDHEGAVVRVLRAGYG